MTSCCAVIGLIILVITNLAIIISFATPYWIEDTQGNNEGLWARCRQDACEWVFEKKFDSNSHTQEYSKEWWIATQALMCFGLGLSLFALLVATIALCCECKGCNSSHAVAALLILCFLTLGVAACVFGLKANEKGVEYDFTSKHGNRFGWSFWLNVGASLHALLTASVYACEGRSKHS